ncbi:hypothetical protein GCM10022243_67760 [Saccharothrix violaceirubra]|uniref:Uncharacterized protein n=1 Tax=Saccharothrix violaceirubra TaxID=413306 RepID=A0A7W7T8G1_9PSEU|nr:hypothetical protein [Saccharothrix violaceirubra]MBB4968489.1 hypothetical protein [Saccharothrix violaceirubra]
MGDQQKASAQWEGAYRRFTEASERSRYSGPDDPDAACRLASAYRSVAWSWRQLASIKTIPWWAKAAALHAADTFDQEASLCERVADSSATRERSSERGGNRP